MSPTTVTVTLLAVPLTLGVCVGVYGIVTRRKRALIGVIVLLLISLGSPVAYYVRTQRRIEEYVGRLGNRDQPLSDYERRELVGMGSWAVPALTELLASDDRDKWVGAVIVLGRIGAGAQDALASLRQNELKADPIEKLWIHSALARIDASPDEHIAILVAALRSPEGPHVRISAAQALREVGTRALPALPEVEAAAKRAHEEGQVVEDAVLRASMDAWKHDVEFEL